MKVKSVMKFFISTIFLSFMFSGCAMTQNHYDPKVDENLTLGKAQREIKIGMSSAEVIEIMGSPNIVSTDEKRREVWIYDKISTQVAYSKSSAGITGLIFGMSGGLLGGVNGEGGSSSKTQRTLTVIIKFDEENKVRDLSYHSTSF